MSTNDFTSELASLFFSGFNFLIDPDRSSNYKAHPRQILLGLTQLPLLLITIPFIPLIILGSLIPKKYCDCLEFPINFVTILILMPVLSIITVPLLYLGGLILLPFYIYELAKNVLKNKVKLTTYMNIIITTYGIYSTFNSSIIRPLESLNTDRLGTIQNIVLFVMSTTKSYFFERYLSELLTLRVCKDINRSECLKALKSSESFLSITNDGLLHVSEANEGSIMKVRDELHLWMCLKKDKADLSSDRRVSLVDYFLIPYYKSHLNLSTYLDNFELLKDYVVPSAVIYENGKKFLVSNEFAAQYKEKSLKELLSGKFLESKSKIYRVKCSQMNDYRELTCKNFNMLFPPVKATKELLTQVVKNNVAVLKPHVEKINNSTSQLDYINTILGINLFIDLPYMLETYKVTNTRQKFLKSCFKTILKGNKLGKRKMETLIFCIQNLKEENIKLITSLQNDVLKSNFPDPSEVRIYCKKPEISSDNELDKAKNKFFAMKELGKLSKKSMRKLRKRVDEVILKSELVVIAKSYVKLDRILKMFQTDNTDSKELSTYVKPCRNILFRNGSSVPFQKTIWKARNKRMKPKDPLSAKNLKHQEVMINSKKQLYESVVKKAASGRFLNKKTLQNLITNNLTARQEGFITYSKDKKVGHKRRLRLKK